MIDNTSMKLVSFPALVNAIETYFICKEGAMQDTGVTNFSNVTVCQQTFGLATVLSFTCEKGHAII